MASEREAAKNAIIVREGNDPELSGALSDAHNLQFELQKENNRHAEAMRRQELGLVGSFIGGKENAPTIIALGLLIFGAVIVVGALIVAGFVPEQQEFWAKQAERGFALATAAGAFLAGKATRD